MMKCDVIFPAVYLVSSNKKVLYKQLCSAVVIYPTLTLRIPAWGHLCCCEMYTSLGYGGASQQICNLRGRYGKQRAARGKHEAVLPVQQGVLAPWVPVSIPYRYLAPVRLAFCCLHPSFSSLYLPGCPTIPLDLVVSWLFQEVIHGDVMLLLCLYMPQNHVCLLSLCNAAYKSSAGRSSVLVDLFKLIKAVNQILAFAKAGDLLVTFLLRFQESVVLDASPVSLGSQ